jgi:hypothetical protein
MVIQPGFDGWVVSGGCPGSPPDTIHPLRSSLCSLSLPCYLTTIETSGNSGVAVMLLVLYEIL